MDRSLKMFTPARRNERCQPGARLGQKQKTTTNLIINYRLSEAVAHRRHGFTGTKKKKMNLISLNLFAQWKTQHVVSGLLCFVSEEENKRPLSRREKQLEEKKMKSPRSRFSWTRERKTKSCESGISERSPFALSVKL